MLKSRHIPYTIPYTVMAKVVKQLTDLKVRRAANPRVYPDGEGLYLQVRETGAKDWFYTCSR